MKAFRSALCLLGLLVALPATAAPKNIILMPARRLSRKLVMVPPPAEH